AVAGMDGISATIFGHPHQLLDIEIALAWRRTDEGNTLLGEKRVRGAGIRLPIDRYRRNTHLAAGPHHPKGNLATLGDEDLGDASQSSSTRRWERRWPLLWQTRHAPFRRPWPRCRSASSSPPARRPRHRGVPCRPLPP